MKKIFYAFLLISTFSNCNTAAQIMAFMTKLIEKEKYYSVHQMLSWPGLEEYLRVSTSKAFEYIYDATPERLQKELETFERKDYIRTVQGDSFIEGRDIEGSTPLAYAASLGRVEVIALLCEQGAQVNRLLNNRL